MTTTTRRSRTGTGGAHDPAIVPIDPNNQVQEQDLRAPTRGRPSPWRDQLEKLIEMVASGDVELGNFVRIGEFKSYQGAQHRGTRMAEFEPELAAGYAFEYRWQYIKKGEGGVPQAPGGRSELWARMTYTAPVAVEVAADDVRGVS